MRPDFMLELKRQLVHLLVGLAIAAAVYLLYPAYGTLILIPLLLSVAVMLILPKIASDLKISNHLLYHFERDHNIKNFPFKGAIYYGIGVTAPILFLPVDGITGRPLLACAVIAVLSAGDSMSTLIGKPCGRYRVGHKSIEGFLAFMVAGFLAAYIFIPHNPALAFTFALTGGLVELFIHRIDDNLLIPITLTITYHLLNIITSNPIF